MRRRAPTAVLLLALLAGGVFGCPPPVVGDRPPPGDVPLTSESYCESIVDFFCPFYLRCGRMAVANQDECAPVFLEACHARFEPKYVALEKAGLLSLSQEGIGACRAHLESVECDQQIRDLDGPCADMWIGTQTVGEGCGFDIESFVCAPGSVCVLDVTLCGTCHTVVDDGADCTRGGVTCRKESFCDDGVCVARKRVGEACTPNDRCVLGAICSAGVCRGPSYVGVGDACDFEHRCPYRSQCLDGVCRAAAALGDSCDALTPCDSGFCGDDDVCAALTPPGGACSDDVQCQTGLCGDDEVCDSLPSICAR